MVVSFMIAIPFSLVGRRSIRPDHRTDLIGRSRVRPADSFCTLPENGPHVGDVVLLNRHREHRRRCSVSGPLLRKVSSATCDSQRSKPLPRPRVEQIGGDREIEAASCPASLFGDALQPVR
jgi:hypothetical protein